MKDQLSMFEPTTSAATASATSSQASASGATPSGKRAGRMTKKSGLEAAPASRSATPAREKRSMMSAIFGRSGSHFSASAALALSLANRLQAVSASLGSTLYTLTWKARRTPSGRSIPALRASEARTSGSGFTGWPTPQHHDDRMRGNTMADHHYFPHDLPNAAELVGWQTPVSNDAKGSGYAYDQGDHEKVRLKLPGEVKLCGWARPAARDWAGRKTGSYGRGR